jgi:LacI family transcriptional regulator
MHARRSPAHSPVQPPSSSGVPRVAILVDTSTNWGRSVLNGVIAYTRAHGPWQIFVEARGLEEHLQLPKGWAGDGVIARVSTDRMAAELKAKRLPVVNVSGIELPGVKFPRVSTDLIASARLAAEHFLERGFRHFAYFSLLGLTYVATHQRAFIQAVTTGGGDFASFAVKPQAGAEPDWRLDLAKLGAWAQSLPKPVAILCWNASSAREVVFACQEAGLHVPEEVAVLSQADDDVLCEAAQIPISGIRAAGDTIGFQAARLLNQLMQGEAPPAHPHFIAPLSIVSRQSTDSLAIRDPAIAKALAFIRQQANLPVRVADVARHAGVSRRVLERRFMDQLQRSPAAELRRFQLHRARQLLAETSLPMPQVAEKSGFGSQAYLAAMFRKHFNQTPKEFRLLALGRIQEKTRTGINLNAHSRRGADRSGN